MPTTVDEYIEQTKALIERGAIGETITPTSAILNYTANSNPWTGTGYTFLADFGFLVAWLRYGLVTEEFDPSDLPLWKYSEDELRYRRAAAEAGFDRLLQQFVESGYKPDMAIRLLEIGDDYFHGFSLNGVYVLPGDLDEVLSQVGNPFAAFWSDVEETDVKEEDITAAGIGFDLNNPEHREKLAERLIKVGL